MFVVLAACGVLAAPALIVGGIGMVGRDPAVGLVALAVGLVVGAGVIVVGVLVGGRTLERTGGPAAADQGLPDDLSF